MKPTPQTIKTRSDRDSFTTFAKGPRFPKTDCHFQAGRGDDFSGGSKGRFEPPFRGISNDYFKNEARTHFASEALVFGVIVVIAAVPVYEAIAGLFRFVYGGL